jgi:hypothetical protein
MSAIAGMQATTMTPATSNSKDYSTSMTAHNSRNASKNSNERNNSNESNNRTANTIETPAKAEMLPKVLKPAAAAAAGTRITSEMTAAAGTVGTS